jgi:integrase
MASLQERNGSFRFIFRYHGKQHFVAIGQVSRDEAEAKANQVGYLLLRLKQRLIELPPGVGIVDFLRHDGRPAAASAPVGNNGVASLFTLAAFRDRYLDTHRASLERRTVEGIELHFRHLVAVLGERFPIGELTLADLQGYVDTRAKARGTAGQRLSPATIRKEIVSLRTAWNWAAKMGLVSGRFPNDGLRFAKADEKPPFMTRDEIERRIAAGALTKHRAKELWAALFLTLPEIEELLTAVRQSGTLPWVYPMLSFAAHTGARRSEILRVCIEDVDFVGKAVLIHEKKRTRGKRTTRRVPLSGFLAGVLKQWLASHPGGPYLFCYDAIVPRSRKRSRLTGFKGDKTRASTASGRLDEVGERQPPGFSPITEDEAHDHLRRSLRGSRWEVIKGWHVARHSFASNCAAKGIDQRLIDRWLGHTTDEMRRRYQHLIPNQEQQAIGAVFG